MIYAIITTILFVSMIFITSIIGTVFMYMGWNWGLVPTFDPWLHEIGFKTAFWLSMCIATIGGFFKTTMTPSQAEKEIK